MLEPLLTIKQVSEALNVQEQTVRRWIKAARKISFIKLPGGDLRIRKEFLENWLNSRTVKAKPLGFE